ncbi:hypothetical protein BC829DRAFT_182884 [Chytridium lagenaria]|nr:hypothetical protein BC829DRAFT_182884 [Chytridium lagenaria]
MKILMNHVKFLQLSGSSTEASVPTMRKKKPKNEDAGIVLGQPLPKNGICSHYRKSYRWFRFPCCGKVYPCDLCHGSSDHEMVWANRMICGYCSREQAYSPNKACACGRELTRTSNNKGYWEGGLGTRDKKVMSRHEGRKYKGMNKTVSMKSTRVGPKTGKK